jgi:hypothetical protein
MAFAARSPTGRTAYARFRSARRACRRVLPAVVACPLAPLLVLFGVEMAFGGHRLD